MAPKNSTKVGASLLPSPPSSPPSSDSSPPPFVDNYDISFKEYYGRDHMKLNTLVQVNVDGLLRLKEYVDKDHSRNKETLKLLSIDVGSRKCGIAQWDETSDKIEAIGEGRIKTENVVEELKAIMSKDGKKLTFGLVIGLPMSAEGVPMEKMNHAHIDDFIQKLDGNDFFHGVPFCFVNEHGSSATAAIRCKIKRINWDKKINFNYEVCKDREAARIIMENFLLKVKKELLSNDVLIERELELKQVEKEKESRRREMQKMKERQNGSFPKARDTEDVNACYFSSAYLCIFILISVGSLVTLLKIFSTFNSIEVLCCDFQSF